MIVEEEEGWKGLEGGRQSRSVEDGPIMVAGPDVRSRQGCRGVMQRTPGSCM